MIKINNNDCNGTGLRGYVKTSYKNLVSKLGKPYVWFEHDKVDVEWCFKFPDGTIATVYNYKDGKNYLGEKGKAVEDITNWHIGGNNNKSIGYMQLKVVANYKVLN